MECHLISDLELLAAFQGTAGEVFILQGEFVQETFTDSLAVTVVIILEVTRVEIFIKQSDRGDGSWFEKETTHLVILPAKGCSVLEIFDDGG